MGNQAYVRDVSAVAFGGRILGLEPGRNDAQFIQTNTNLVAPGLSCALPSTGGAALASTAGPLDFSIQGHSVATLGHAETEVSDRTAGRDLSMYSRASVRQLRVGIDTRLTLDSADVELASVVTGDDEEDDKPHLFEFRQLAVRGLQFKGIPIQLTFWDLPSSYDELDDALKALECSDNKPFVRRREGYIEFSAVKEVRGGAGTSPVEKRPHALKLENLGTVEFGIVQATEYSRNFVLMRMSLGSPIVGPVMVAYISSGGKG